MAGAAREREVEDREGRQDEEQHRGQRLLRPQLEEEILARKRGDVSKSQEVTTWFMLAGALLLSLCGTALATMPSYRIKIFGAPEGDKPKLEVEIRNPHIGILNSSRKTWASAASSSPISISTA